MFILFKRPICESDQHDTLSYTNSKKIKLEQSEDSDFSKPTSLSAGCTRSPQKPPKKRDIFTSQKKMKVKEKNITPKKKKIKVKKYELN